MSILNCLDSIEMYENLDLNFDLEKDSHLNDELDHYYALWGAVILQAIIDSVNNHYRSEEKIEKIRATAWLKGGSEDFMAVCHLANYNYKYVQEKAFKHMLKAKNSKPNLK